MSKLLTSQDKNIITQDWHLAFPDYSVYKPLHLIKRHGPILFGIYLKPVYGGEHYIPVFHTHSLLKEFPVISLSTPMPFLNFKGVEESISLLRHTREKEKIINKFKEQVFISTCNGISLSVVDYIYNKTIKSALYAPIQSIMEHILFHAYMSNNETLNLKINEYKIFLNNYPKVLKDNYDEKAFLAVVDNLSVSDLKNLVQSEIIKFKLESLKDKSYIE